MKAGDRVQIVNIPKASERSKRLNGQYGRVEAEVDEHSVLVLVDGYAGPTHVARSALRVLSIIERIGELEDFA